jgi:mannose-1-phosphate guanylyltransferase/phosphomannomutase
MTDLDALIAVTNLLFMTYPGSTVGVPLTAPRILDRIASAHEGRIRRLKVGQTYHLKAAATGKFAMIGDARGSFIFPGFTPFPDGMFAVAKIMELTAQAGQTLSDIWRAREPYHLARAAIPCPWEEKGRLNRLLRERLRDAGSDSAEGVYIDRGDEWILILPDPDEPSFWVHAEGRDAQHARELVDEYNLLVSSLLQE